MLHEFMFSTSLKQVDEQMEKLTLHEFYNLYYDQPIEQFADDNGYGFQKVMDVDTDLKIFLEETGEAPVNPQKVKEEIASILKVKKEAIHYQFHETEEWQQPFPVIPLQNGWYIKPTHSKEEMEGRVIHFEPPRAFGSGLHGTTQDCLRFILGRDLYGKKVLDLGTGAGLLAIAAALAGAKQVVAVDIEDVEAEVLYNVELNKVENRVSVIQGDVLDPTFTVEGLFDWILVNIAANEIIALHPFLESHLVAEGKLLLSGMVEWNYQKTLAAYIEQGFHLDEISRSDEWVTVLITKS
jgi:ribosomal protein L11 methyltransferase